MSDETIGKPPPGPELDDRVQEILTGVDISARPVAGIGFNLTPYSTDDKANEAVQAWLRDNDWRVLTDKWEDDTRTRFVVEIVNKENRRIRVIGAHSAHAFCLAIQRAVPRKPSL